MIPFPIGPITLLLLLASCAPEFAPAAELSGLRVLAVQKDAPYAKPGQRVTLRMLWTNEDPQAQQRVPEIAWFALCDNPAGDLYSLCFEQIAAVGTGSTDDLAQLAGRISLPTTEGSEPVGANDTFSFEVPDDIISARQSSDLSAPVPYGVSYVFFAACAGTLSQDFSLPIPVACYRELDGMPGLSAGDQRLGPDGFVVGYTAVYSYENLRNANPSIRGFEVAGQFLTETSSSPGNSASEPLLPVPRSELCIGSSCRSELSASQDEEPMPCSAELTLPDCPGPCTAVEIRALMSPTTAEPDEVATQLAGTALQEQMWINYYATAGEFEGGDIKLLNDATTGWNPRSAVRYIADRNEHSAIVWAVAHDNRGGTQWGRLRLCTQLASDN